MGKLTDIINNPSLPPLIEQVPALVFRMGSFDLGRKPCFVTSNINRFGYTPEDFATGKVSWSDLVHPDDIVLVSKTIKDYLAKKVNSFKLTSRLVAKNGIVYPITAYNTFTLAKDGSVVCHDITILLSSTTEMECCAIDNGYRQQLVLNDILISLQSTNLDLALQMILDRTGAYLDTSRALLFKDSPDHKTCKIVYEWCNTDIESVMALDYSITYATNMPEIYTALQSTGSLIIDYGHIPDNCKEEFDAEGLIASAIFAVYLNGQHYGFVCFDDCVVERTWNEETIQFLKNISNLLSSVLASIHASEQLAQNQRAYEAVLDNLDDLIFVTDKESDAIVFANSAFKNLFGEGESCIGKPSVEYIDLSLAVKLGPDTTLDGVAQRFELQHPGTLHWSSVLVEDITWLQGEKVRLVTCHDITEEKRLEETLEEKIVERTKALQLMKEEAEAAREKAEAAANAKTQFLTNMSHEIRTPMNAILGLSELLENSELNYSQREHIKNIRSSSNLLLHVINDILDIAKLDSGKLSLIPEHYNLMDSVEQVAALFKSIASTKGLMFKLTTPTQFDLCLYGDDIRLRQILINLLSNAVKFTGRGHVELSVETSDKQVTLKVSDTGSGIKPEELETIFEPFAQGDIHKNRKLQGTGLGLAICHSLVSLMGGSITVNSTLSVGSTFTVTIPLVQGDPNKIGQTGLEADNSPVYAPEVKVLVVDDIDMNLYVAEAMLQEHGIETIMAHSGAEAIELVQNNDIDLVLMDHMMPEMDGIKATKAIRDLGEKYARLPVIVFTANVVSEARDMFKRAGMDDFLAKPVEASILNSILQKWLPAEKIQHRQMA